MKMKTLLLGVASIMLSTSLFAGDLISVTPNDGNGVRLVRVYYDSGNPGERATNLLLDKTIEENQAKKWCTANNDGENQIDVIFELSDFYDLDKFIIYDCKTQEDDINIASYQISLSEEPGWDASWTVVVDKTNQNGIAVKTDEIAPTKARYVKLTTYDTPIIRVYGFEIYGTKSEESDHPKNLISVAKPVLKYYDLANGNIHESPVSLFDGNTENLESKWCFARALDTDSLKYAVVDLLDLYNINEFKLYDCKYLEYDDNIIGYNVYVSETMPNLDLITNLEDGNTCWTKVVDAYASDRLLDDIKEDVLTEPIRGRYVKLEIPRSMTLGTVRLFEFQVFGEKAGGNSINSNESKTLDIYPSIFSGSAMLTLNNTVDGQFSIHSLNGKLLYSVLAAPMAQIQVNLPVGVYIAKMTTDGENQITKIISK